MRCSHYGDDVDDQVEVDDLVGYVTMLVRMRMMLLVLWRWWWWATGSNSSLMPRIIMTGQPLSRCPEYVRAVAS